MKLTYDTIAQSVEASKEIQDLVPPVLLAIRRELKLPLNEQQYLELMEEMNQNAGRSFDEFMRKVRADDIVAKDENA